MNLKKFAAVFAASFLVSAPVFAQATFVTVNGVAVPRYVADVLIEEQKAAGVPESAEMRDAVREALIRRELIVAEARRAGLEKKPEIQGMMENARLSVLVRAYIEDYLQKNPVSDADISAAYEMLKQQRGNTEYHVRHILVAEEKEAQEIIAKLKKGSKFATLAESSLDVASQGNGGEIGWMSPAAFVPPFAQALSQLQKGQYSQTPVQTDFGYHVIMVDDIRATEFPALEQVQGQIRQGLNQQKVENLLEGLRAKAVVK
ncbi:MAG: peptidylprolyl isomerase [Betaproteobacteria bacterium]|nr:peptidylprolyl isomerase [Betaproteobacteria bacterium]